MNKHLCEDLKIYASDLEILELSEPIIFLEEVDASAAPNLIPEDAATISYNKIEYKKRETAPKHNTANDIDGLMAGLFSEAPGEARRPSGNVESRIDSALAGLINNRIQTKALPLALRKRLLYQRTLSG